MRSHITQGLGQPRQNTLKDPAVIGEERLFPPQLGAKGDRQRVEKSFTRWYLGIPFSRSPAHVRIVVMMNGGDLYELAKILGHSNIRMTERYAKLGKAHIARRHGARYVDLNGRCSARTGCLMFAYCL